MSESPRNGNNKSNKDIIDELTKNIKNDFTENPDSEEDFVKEHKGSSQDNVPPDNSSFQYAMETRIRASPQQFSFLVEFMERHGDLSKPPRGPLGRTRSERLWVELAGMANSVGGGVHKSSEKWKKVWADWKTKTKKKYLGMRQRAGNNRSMLSSLEERVLAIMGATVVRQPPTVQEPAVNVNQRTTREEPSFVVSRSQNGAVGDFKVEEDDDDECQGEESKDDHDDDGTDDEIDETQLKDAEMDMTDDQKEERRIIAEELKIAGNNAYKDGEFARSAEKYTEGLRICPLQFAQQRAVLFCNRSAAKMKMEKYKKAVADCTKAIELDDKYLKAYIRRAQSYEEQEKFDESLADYKKILELDPSHQEAKKATIRLPPLIEEKNEKLKHEMLGKLKDLGNMILKPFGLSTENFQMEQDAGTKGYKINFKQ